MVVEVKEETEADKSVGLRPSSEFKEGEEEEEEEIAAVCCCCCCCCSACCCKCREVVGGLLPMDAATA